jgi:ubiquinone/menaquinone biosynthesis C-methylase UbiE
MVKKANLYEKEDDFGINYTQADIAFLPYKDNFFDKVACIAVLMHSNPDEYIQFLLEAFRVLRPGGRLIISITHPSLYYTHRSQKFWANFSPLEKKHSSKSGFFKEMYRDIHGDELVCEVWRHPKKFILDTIKKNFTATVEHTQSIYLTEEVLKACNQKGKVGEVCFYQIVARKYS